MRKLTREDFIERARSVHGATYDYSLVEYVNNSTKVKIICPVHGVFEQTPQKHMNGRGCPHKECIDAHRRATSLAKFGVENAMQSASIRKKLVESNLEKYGVENPMQTSEVRDKLRASVQAKYGVDCTFSVESAKAKRKITLTEKYGGNSPMCSEEVRMKAAETMRERYGAPAALQSPELLEKARRTVFGHYGVSNPMHDKSVKQRVTFSKQQNGTFHTSAPEDMLYEQLCTVFGEDDVARQFTSALYPFSCDFYVKSRDLYIELNASWTHGKHWFDGSSDADVAVLDDWREKSVDSGYYKNAVHVWTDADVKKREAARASALNYVVFWDNDLRDAELWFGLNCPDGRDWEQSYSWLGV